MTRASRTSRRARDDDPARSCSATGALVVLGFLWVGVLGLVGIVALRAVGRLARARARPRSPRTSITTSRDRRSRSAVGTAAAVVGIGLAYAWYVKSGSEAPAQLGRAASRACTSSLMDKWRVDELYDATILRRVARRSACCRPASTRSSSTACSRASRPRSCRASASLFTRIQNGLVHAYGAVMVGGLLGVTWWFIDAARAHRAAEPPKGDAVAARSRARPRLPVPLGLRLRRRVRHRVERPTPARRTRTSTTSCSRGVRRGARVGDVRRRRSRRSTRLQLGRDAAARAARPRPTAGSATATTTRRRCSSADERRPRRARERRARAQGRQVRAPRTRSCSRAASTSTIGQARLTAAGSARATLRVRNAFGVERQTRARAACCPRSSRSVPDASRSLRRSAEARP